MAASSQREDRGDREGGIRVKYDGSALVPVTGPVRACMRRVGCNGWCRALSTNDVDRYNPRDKASVNVHLTYLIGKSKKKRRKAGIRTESG